MPLSLPEIPEVVPATTLDVIQAWREEAERTRMGFFSSLVYEPDGWQVEALEADDNRMLLNCSRQSGKSLIASAIACYNALFNPGSLTLILSPSLRQSGELFRKVRELWTGSGKIVGGRDTQLTLELNNGSRIISLPGRDESTVRGYSAVSLLLIDEASRVSDDLYKSVRPMLATSGGRLIALSTPFGKRGWWWEAWRDSERGEADWRRFLVTADHIPRIPPEFLEEERRTLGPTWFAQEYMCSFEESMNRVFATEDIAEMFDTHFDAWAV